MPTNTLPVDILAVAVVIILPLDEINPPVNKLPPVMLAVTAKLPRVPTEVIFVCEAVCKVPVRLVANTLPPVILPLALSIPCTCMPLLATQVLAVLL